MGNNRFDDVLKRLTESMIKIIVRDDLKKTEISVINPSVNDYLRDLINKNFNIQARIIENSYYIQQVVKIINVEPIGGRTCFHPKLIELGSIDEKDTFYHFLNLVFNLKITDIALVESINKSFEFLCKNKSRDYEGLIIKILNSKNEFFYKFDEILIQNIGFIINNFSFDGIIFVYNYTSKLYKYEDDFLNRIKIRLISTLEMKTFYKSDELLLDVISDITFYDSSRIYYDNEGNFRYDDLLVFLIEDQLYDVVKEFVNDNKSMCPMELSDFEIDIDDILGNLNIEGVLDDYLANDYLENYYDYSDEDKIEPDKELEMIHDLFLNGFHGKK